jgi:hypothetical protein
MATWSSHPFGNDTACDWRYGLTEVDDLSLIEETIRTVLQFGENALEALAAEEAIAACDTLARLKGRFHLRDSHTEPVDLWVAAHPLTPPPALVASALEALDRILTAPSELLERWSESEESDEWHSQMADLRERLQ